MAVWCLFLLLGLAVGQGPEKRRTGNVCKTDMDCPDNAFCRQNSYCVCKEGFVYAALNGTHKGCLKEASIGDDCVQNIQCHSRLGVHSECIDGICACKTKAHLVANRCYETAVIGDRCISDENCFLGDSDNEEYLAYCVRGYCSCQLMYSPRDNGTRCVRDANLGEVCEDQQQCASVGLECRGTCRCKEGWVVHNDTNAACLESVKSLNEPCDYDVQCDALSGSHEAPSSGATLCLSGVCTCAYNAHSAGEPLRCWHNRLPRQECRRDEECVSEEGEPGYCAAGRCTCKTCSPDAKDFNSANLLDSKPLLAAILAVFSLGRWYTKN